MRSFLLEPLMVQKVYIFMGKMAKVNGKLLKALANVLEIRALVRRRPFERNDAQRRRIHKC